MSRDSESSSFAAQIRSAVALIRGWFVVSIDLFGLLRKVATWEVYVLVSAVLVNAGLLYVFGKVLGWKIDELRLASEAGATATLRDAFELTFPLWAVFCAILFTEMLVRVFSAICEKFSLEFFNAYFPRTRVHFGMESFQGGNKTFNMLSRANDAEYSMGFFVPQQIKLIGHLLRGLIGGGIVLYYIPAIGVLLSAVMLLVLFVQIRNAVHLTLEERKLWPQKAECTATKKMYQDKERMKAITLFGIEHDLVDFLDARGREIYTSMRRIIYRHVPKEAATIGLLSLTYLLSLSVLVHQALSGTFTVGESAFLITTLISLGYTVRLIVENVGNQAKGADKIAELFDYMKSEKAAANRLGGDSELQLTDAPRIEVKNLSFGYEKKRQKDVPEEERELDLILSDISCVFPAGEVTYVVGRNGCGKSTLFNCLSHLYPLSSGELLVDEIAVPEVSVASLRRSLRHLPQGTLRLRFRFREMLAFAAGYGYDPHACPEDLMWRALQLACLDEKVRSFKRGLDEPMAIWNNAKHDLSGGQAKMADIAMFFAGVESGTTRALILDEPFVGVDPPNAQKIAENIRNCNATVLMSTHLVERIPDQAPVVYLDKELTEDGPTSRVYSGIHQEMLATLTAYAGYCAQSTSVSKAS